MYLQLAVTLGDSNLLRATADRRRAHALVAATRQPELQATDACKP